jgi:hypothetical protein
VDFWKHGRVECDFSTLVVGDLKLVSMATKPPYGPYLDRTADDWTLG